MAAVLLVTAMRVGTARSLPVDRRRDRRGERHLSPVALRRPTSARAGLQVGGTCAAFLIVSSVLQLLHAAGRDAAALTAICRIPLFARFVASTLAAPLLGLGWPVFIRDREWALARLPRLLAGAIAIFVVTVVFFS